MSLLHTVTHVSLHHHADPSDYDHQISLLDATQPQSPQSPQPSPGSGRLSVSQDEAGDPTSPTSPRSSDAPLGRKWTLREELARRKYSKWQGGRSSGPLDAEASSLSGSDDNYPSGRLPRGVPRLEVGPADDGASSRSGPGQAGRESEMDVLYENQRGTYMCGLPLFSHQSLLNLDPSPWTTAAFKDSPVDVTNAQLPDPSWEWAWKSWYVDMSSDVDDEGWQYSFSFSPAFAWHGSHVWFHSFVRRRRWLRKRVKVSARSPRPTSGSLSSPRLLDGRLTLDPDHPRAMSSRSASRASSKLSDSEARTSSVGPRRLADDDQDLSKIHNMHALMRALKSGRIDREKVEAVKTYLDNATGDMAHLAEHMPAIMSSFVFQASRRQLLAHLLQTYEAAAAAAAAKDSTADGADKVRAKNLQGAVDAADEQVRRLEYWSDIRAMARAGESKGAADERQGWDEAWQGLDESGAAGPAEAGEEGRQDDAGGAEAAGTEPKLDKGKVRE